MYLLSILSISYCVGIVSKGLLKVYGCKKCPECRVAALKVFQDCLRHVCEKSVYGMIGSEAD